MHDGVRTNAAALPILDSSLRVVVSRPSQRRQLSIHAETACSHGEHCSRGLFQRRVEPRLRGNMESVVHSRLLERTTRGREAAKSRRTLPLSCYLRVFFYVFFFFFFHFFFVFFSFHLRFYLPVSSISSIGFLIETQFFFFQRFLSFWSIYSDVRLDSVRGLCFQQS